MKLAAIVTSERFRPLMFAMVACLPILAFWSGTFPLDDAYITLTNARTLLGGADPFRSSYLDGATSPIHLLLVALGGLVIPLPWSSLIVGLAGMGMYVAGLWKLANRVTGARKYALLIVGALSGNALFHYLNGLETSLAMAATAWLLVWWDDWRLPVLAGLAAFVRPELGVLSALLVARSAWLAGGSRGALIWGATIATAAPLAIWTYSQTGHLIPTTIAAKLAYSHVWQQGPAERIVQIALILIALQIAPMFVGVLGFQRAAAGWILGAFLASLLIVCALTVPDSLGWNRGRYAAIFIPILFAGWVALLYKPRLWSDVSLAALTCLAVANTGFVIRDLKGSAEGFEALRGSSTFVAKLPRDSVILVHDAGIVSWEAPHAHLVDVVGLKTPRVVDINQRLIRAPCMRAEATDAVATTYHATHLVVLNGWEWPCLAQSLRKAGWDIKPVFEGVHTVYELRRGRYNRY